MKYIMMETQVASVKKMIPIIFPDFMCHLDMAEAVKSILDNKHEMASKVLGAGDIDLGPCTCFGESSTLNVSSSLDDADIINSYDYFHGLWTNYQER